jgi:hypothetical protein
MCMIGKKKQQQRPAYVVRTEKKTDWPERKMKTHCS